MTGSGRPIPWISFTAVAQTPFTRVVLLAGPLQAPFSLGRPERNLDGRESPSHRAPQGPPFRGSVCPAQCRPIAATSEMSLHE